MAKKKKPEEHENLERWLVSYADFMTLLFATFVVLYALSQINVNEFKKVEESLKKAFSVQSILDGKRCNVFRRIRARRKCSQFDD